MTSRSYSARARADSTSTAARYASKSDCVTDRPSSRAARRGSSLRTTWSVTQRTSKPFRPYRSTSSESASSPSLHVVCAWSSQSSGLRFDFTVPPSARVARPLATIRLADGDELVTARPVARYRGGDAPVPGAAVRARRAPSVPRVDPTPAGARPGRARRTLLAPGLPGDARAAEGAHGRLLGLRPPRPHRTARGRQPRRRAAGAGLHAPLRAAVPD